MPNFAHLIVINNENGGEYVNKKTINFFTENSIQLQHTIPYNPQQNGVDERKNCTLK